MQKFVVYLLKSSYSGFHLPLVMRKISLHMLMYSLYFIYLLCCKQRRSGSESLSRIYEPGLPGLHIPDFLLNCFMQKFAVHLLKFAYSGFLLPCVTRKVSLLVLMYSLYFIWCNAANYEDQDQRAFRGILIWGFLVCTYMIFLCIVLCRNWPFMGWCILCNLHVCYVAINEDQDQKAFRRILILVFLVCTYLIFYCIALCRNLTLICVICILWMLCRNFLFIFLCILCTFYFAMLQTMKIKIREPFEEFWYRSS